jgi:hypothetical protein
MAKNDDTIKQLMARVAAQKVDMGDRPKATWVTNGIILSSDGSHTNINTVRDSETFIKLLSHILALLANHAEAARLLGLQPVPSVWNGHTIDDYVADFKMRIAILSWIDKKASLEATEKKLAALVSEEARTEMDLEAIAKSLGL